MWNPHATIEGLPAYFEDKRGVWGSIFLLFDLEWNKSQPWPFQVTSEKSLKYPGERAMKVQPYLFFDGTL